MPHLIVHGFRLESENFEFSKKEEQNGLISVSQHFPVRSYVCAKSLVNTPSMVFGQNLKISTSVKSDTIGKGMSRGAE